jgi:hypothetical protein
MQPLKKKSTPDSTRQKKPVHERVIEPSTDPTLAILLAELNIIANHWEHSDQIAESRLNILLTSTSGAAAVLILLDQLGISFNSILEVSGIVFIILWMLGILTFIRMLERNFVTIHSSRSMNRIRGYFVKRKPELVPYLNIPKEEALQNQKKNKPAMVPFLGSRTLAAVISSVAIGMLVNIAILLFIKPPATQSVNLAAALTLGVVHFVGLEWYAVARLKKL